MKNEQRFKRLEKETVLGFKIADRKNVNQMLSFDEACNSKKFLLGLKMLFGEPDKVGDGRLSYSVHDNITDVSFEAFVGNGGPSYGGGIIHFEDFSIGKLRFDVSQTLNEFDKYLEAEIKKKNL